MWKPCRSSTWNRNKLSTLQGVALGEMFPNLHTLGIADNAISPLPTTPGEKPPDHALCVLRQLPKLRHLEVARNPATLPPAPPSPEAEAGTEEGGEGAEAATPPPPPPPPSPPVDFNPRPEVIICHWRLESIDGQPVTPEEVEAARQLHLSNLEQERARLKAAADAAAAAEGGDS